MIYFLLAIIAVGVLLASEPGKKLLVFLIIAGLIIGSLFLIFMILSGLYVWADSDSEDILAIIIGLAFIVGLTYLFSRPKPYSVLIKIVDKVNALNKNISWPKAVYGFYISFVLALLVLVLLLIFLF